MKKAIIALAVAAGSIAAAQAADTTTLYGSIGFSSNIISDVKFKDVADSVKEHNWGLKNDHVRLGVKGNEDLGNGLQATFKIEGDNSSFAGRDAYLGLKGGFGEVRFGRQGSTWNVSDGFFETSDPAFGVGAGDIKDLWKKAARAELSAANATKEQIDAEVKKIDDYKIIDSKNRKNSTIKYISPDFNGLTFAGRIQADSENPASKGVDAWDVAVAYKANGFKASAAYAVAYDAFVPMGAAYSENLEALGVQVGYENDQFGVVGNAQHLSHYGTVYNLQGQYNFDDKSSARAGFGYADPRGDKNNSYNIGLGYQYNLSKRTATWVEGIYEDGDEFSGRKDGTFSASVGIRHDF